MKFYYYGCIPRHGQVGHYLYSEDDQSAQFRVTTPWGPYPDGTLCIPGTQIERVALLHHKDGWTAIGFWDRTGDRRGNSNSNFLAEGTHTFEEMVRMALERFPVVMARIGQITLYAGSGK